MRNDSHSKNPYIGEQGVSCNTFQNIEYITKCFKYFMKIFGFIVKSIIPTLMYNFKNV